MNKNITWSIDQINAHKSRMKRLKGEPEFHNEDEFQSAAEKLLYQCGFRTRCDKHIAQSDTGLWYEHRAKKQAKKQAIIADLFIWDSNRNRYIEIELKNGDTDLTLNQKYLFKRGEITVCRNMAEFEDAVFKWMDEPTV